ncbi:MAG: uracil-DNA glycosylase [Micropruina sp.]
MNPKPLAELVAPRLGRGPATRRPDDRRDGRLPARRDAAGRGYLPAGPDVLRAFGAPLAGVQVLIVGQDPYPTPGHPVGLSFSVAPDVRPLRSLVNIYAELNSDLGVPPAAHGDLSAWFNQGVLLLNRVLTVRPGSPARIAARAGRTSPDAPSRRWSRAAAPWWRSCGDGTRRTCNRCWGTCR